jgi:hypothetical protein
MLPTRSVAFKVTLLAAYERFDDPLLIRTAHGMEPTKRSL